MPRLELVASTTMSVAELAEPIDLPCLAHIDRYRDDSFDAVHLASAVEALWAIPRELELLRNDIAQITDVLGAICDAVDAHEQPAQPTRAPFVQRRWGPPAPYEALAIAEQTVAARPTLETLTDEAWRLGEHVTSGILDKADVARRLVAASGHPDVAQATAAVIKGLDARRGRR